MQVLYVCVYEIHKYYSRKGKYSTRMRLYDWDLVESSLERVEFFEFKPKSICIYGRIYNLL